MKTEIEKAMKVLAKKVTNETKPEEALKYSQSVLNLAHARAVTMDVNKREKD